MKKRFVTSFWNYEHASRLAEENCPERWAKLGMNTPMSCSCENDEERELVLKSLDEAQSRGQKVIVCDKHALWYELPEIGEEEYRRRIKHIAEKFASHPAFYAFHVGDEPADEHWQYMLKAVKITSEYARPFINFLPFFEEDFLKQLKTDHNGYADMLVDAIKTTGLNQLSYDCYFQMFENSAEEGIEYYFYNLNRYRECALRAGVDFWTTLLSVGHWVFRVPTEDDIRWQISTACAHGAKGIFWFYIYGRLLESNYRLSPFDQYYEKTPTYFSLERQMRLFNDHFADRLANSSLKEVFHVGKTYGGTAFYTPDCIKGFNIISREFKQPLIVSRFIGDDGKEFLLLVNNSQTKIERVRCEYNGKSFFLAFAPGQMTIIE